MNRPSLRNKLFIAFRLVLVLAALSAGASLLVADSTECAGADDEELCNKCGYDYDSNVELCKSCSGEPCFDFCKSNEDPNQCAADYVACEAQGNSAEVCSGSADAGTSSDTGDGDAENDATSGADAESTDAESTDVAEDDAGE